MMEFDGEVDRRKGIEIEHERQQGINKKYRSAAADLIPTNCFAREFYPHCTSICLPTAKNLCNVAVHS